MRNRKALGEAMRTSVLNVLWSSRGPRFFRFEESMQFGIAQILRRKSAAQDDNLVRVVPQPFVIPPQSLPGRSPL